MGAGPMYCCMLYGELDITYGVQYIFGPSSSASVSMTTDLTSLFHDDGVLCCCSWRLLGKILRFKVPST